MQKWTKGFSKKGRNYKELQTHDSNYYAANVYNARILNQIQSEIEKIFWNSHIGFRRNRSTITQILTIRQIIERVRENNLDATLVLVDITKAFDSTAREKMEQILLAYGLPKELLPL